MRVPHSVVGRTQRAQTPRKYLDGSADPAAFGAGIGRALQGLGVAMNAQAERLDAEQKRQSMFDVNMRVADESLYAMQDFTERTNNAPLGAEGFSRKVLDDYTARHEQIIGQMQNEGLPEEAVQAMQLKLADLRQGLFGQSMTFQQQSYQAKVGADVQKLGLNLSQVASMSPDEMEGAVETLNESIDALPDLPAIQKQKLKEEYSAAISLAAGFGRAQQNPQAVIQALTGSAPGAHLGDVVGAGKGYTDVRTATGVERRKGTRAWRNNNPGNIEYGPFAKSQGAVGSDGRFAVFPSYEAGRAAKAALIFESKGYRDKTIIGAINRYAPPSENNTSAYAAAVAQAVGVPVTTPVSALSADQRARMLDAMERVEGFRAGSVEVLQGTPAVAPAANGKTGDPVLDALAPNQRAQVLSAARTEYDRQQAAVRGELVTRVGNAEAAYMTTGEYAGRTPTEEEFYAAFDPGEAEQRWAAFRSTQEVGGFIRDMKTMSPSDIATAVQQLMPQDTASPTYAKELEGYNTAVKAQAAIMKAREDDPAGYVTTQYPAVRDAWAGANTPEGRQAAFGAMRTAYEQLGFRQGQMVPFPKGVLESEIERYAGMRPEQKVSALASMRNELGPMFNAGLKQFSENGMRIEAYLAQLVTSNPMSHDVAANVLRGMEIIANDPSRKPSGEQINEQFRQALGSAALMLSPEATDTMNKAATALYVFNGGDPSMITASEYESALRQVVGGTADDESTGIVDMAPWASDIDQKTILPPGVNQTQFEDWQEGLGDEDLLRLGNGAPMYTTGDPVRAADIAAEGVFVRVGPSQYIIMMGSDGKPLANDQGGYFTMTVEPETVRGAVLDIGEVEIPSAVP